MTPDEIGKSYDQIAEQWTNDSFPRSNGIEQHERAIAFLEKKRNALDIGCGSSGRIITLLNGEGFSVEGLDISTRMIELAEERHPNIAFHHEDITNWKFTKQYDFISAWDSIWHLRPDDLTAVLKKMMHGLTKGGVCIFTTGGVDVPGEKTDSAMGPEMYYSVLGISKTLQLITDSGCVCRHLAYDQFPDLHMHIIAQRL